MPNRRLVDSVKCAFTGVMLSLKTERNMRLHFVFTFLALLLCYILRLKASDYALITLASGLVLVSELFNTIIEKSLDLRFPDFNEKIRDIKDMSAGTVLMAAIFAVLVGVFVFGRALLELILV